MSVTNLRPPSSLARCTSLAVLTVGLLTGMSPLATAADAADTAPGTVSVSGQGIQQAPADKVTISTTVHAEEPTAKEVLEAHGAAVKALISAAKAQGLTLQDIITEDLWLQPVYSDDGDDSRISGYEASQSISLNVWNITKAAQVIEAVMESADNAVHLDGLEFDLKNHAPLLKRARAEAFQDARSKAEQYAELGGHTLGDIVTVNDYTETGSRTGNLPTETYAGKGTITLTPHKVTDKVTTDITYELN